MDYVQRSTFGKVFVILEHRDGVMRWGRQRAKMGQCRIIHPKKLEVFSCCIYSFEGARQQEVAPFSGPRLKIHRETFKFSPQRPCKVQLHFLKAKENIERSHQQKLHWCWQSINQILVILHTASVLSLFDSLLTSLPEWPISLLTTSGLRRDGDISWTITFRGHFFSKWATSRGHSQRVTSRGHFLVTSHGLPREVLILGEFSWTFFCPREVTYYVHEMSATLCDSSLHRPWIRPRPTRIYTFSASLDQ